MKKIIGKSIFHGGNINHQKLAELLYKSGVVYDLFEMDEEGILTLHFDEKDLSAVEKCIAENDNTVDENKRTPIELLQQENHLLKAQVKALTEQGEFQDELIAEIATVVYA